MTLSKKIERLLAESSVKSIGPSIADMSADQIISLIDNRAPAEDDFSLADIFSDEEIVMLADNPNIEDMRSISVAIYDAIMDLLAGDGGEDDVGAEEPDGQEDMPDDEEPVGEAFNSHEQDMRIRDRFFRTYKRPADVTAQLQKDGKYDLDALIARRSKPVPDDVLFSLSDLFSPKEIEAIAKHPMFKEMSRLNQTLIMNAIDAQVESISRDIDMVLVNAALSNGILESGNAASAAYAAGMASKDADGKYRLTTLGERHAISLAFDRISELGEFILEDASPESVGGAENDPEMMAVIEKIAKKKTRVSIRPNLNSKGEVTIHAGSLGTKLGSVRAVTLVCDSVVVRPGGQALAQGEGEKTVHAGFIGRLHPEVIMPKSGDAPVTYNPHKGDKEFKWNGKPYEGGGMITMVGWKAFKVR